MSLPGTDSLIPALGEVRQLSRVNLPMLPPAQSAKGGPTRYLALLDSRAVIIA
jgi:hypothetical protein